MFMDYMFQAIMQRYYVISPPNYGLFDEEKFHLLRTALNDGGQCVCGGSKV